MLVPGLPKTFVTKRNAFLYHVAAGAGALQALL